MVEFTTIMKNITMTSEKKNEIDHILGKGLKKSKGVIRILK